ncbi:hypothetical protein C8T65DRAFT_699081 [Cerioporus squamosus]|nr:hypothetical protein C8T65DRAFT_699081 [Cerioporus squamosus]
MFASFARVVFVAALAVSALAAPDVGNPTRTARDAAAPINPSASLHARSPRIPRYTSRTPNASLADSRLTVLAVLVAGTIRVTLTDRTSGAVVNNGYVAGQANSFGEYGFTTNAAQAASVSFCPESGTFDILVLNGLSAYPYFGAVRGYTSSSDNLGDDANYVYIAGTTQTARGPAVVGPNAVSAATGIPLSYESNVWQFGGDNALVPSWVNTDGSTPTQQLVYVPSAGAFAIVGDLEAFIANYGSVDLAAFYFVPA